MKTDYAEMSGLDTAQAWEDVQGAGYDPIERQRELQKIIHEAKGSTVQFDAAKTIGELLARFRFNAEAIDSELNEFRDFLPWKEWKTYDLAETDALKDHDDLVTELKFETVDLLHFVLNLAIALDMTWTEVLAIFETKQVENRRRQQEGY